MGNIPINDRSGPGTQIIWDHATGDKHVITDGGSRVDTFNGATHSWGTYNQQGQLTTLQEIAPEHPPSSASRALIPKAMAGMEIVGSRTPTFRANYMPSGTA